MNMARLLYYPVSFMECGANANKAIECVPKFREGEWYAVERDDARDIFKIWHIIGDYHH